MDIYNQSDELSDLDSEILERIKARQDFLRQQETDTGSSYTPTDQELMDYSLYGVKVIRL